MWSGSTAPFIGWHYRLQQPINEPGPVSAPHPPILIGGSGERKTLRLVAQYGDACSLIGAGDPESIRHKLDVLRQHCADVGRPYDVIEKTLTTQLHLGDGSNGTETADQAIARLQTYADLGVDRVTFDLPDILDPEAIGRFGREIVPAMASMTPAGRERPAAVAS